MNQYTTLSEAVDDLRLRGYVDELQLSENGLSYRAIQLDPEDFRIDEFHRFEGPSDPADMSIVYAVSSDRFSLKGLLVNAFGTYASGIVQRMVQALDPHQMEGRVRPVKAAAAGENVKA